MLIRVLGCSGGIGPGLRTTSLLVDDEILIDAGTGVGDLDLAALARIRRVVITHAHLDHVCGLAFMADNLFDVSEQPVVVHATTETTAVLREHLFNWKIWPDFAELPSADKPLLRWQPLPTGWPVDLGKKRTLTAFPVLHTVPAVGVAVQSERGCFAFSGDTWATPLLWSALNALPRLDLLMIEIAFTDQQAELGERAKHFTPALLGRELVHLRHRPKLLLTHHKPGVEAMIAAQCRSALSGWDYHHLQAGETFHI